MLVTTSRRPGRLARVLCRDLVRVIPKSRYVPRGAKTVEELASIARRLGQNKVMVINSTSGKPSELRFMEVGDEWRWTNAIVNLGWVKLQRDFGKRVELEDTKIYAEGAGALEFAELVGRIWGVGLSKKMPDSGGVALVKSEGGIEILFKVMPSSETVGPVLHIVGFGRLYEE